MNLGEPRGLSFYRKSVIEGPSRLTLIEAKPLDAVVEPIRRPRRVQRMPPSPVAWRWSTAAMSLRNRKALLLRGLHEALGSRTIVTLSPGPAMMQPLSKRLATPPYDLRDHPLCPPPRFGRMIEDDNPRFLVLGWSIEFAIFWALLLAHMRPFAGGFTGSQGTAGRVEHFGIRQRIVWRRERLC